MESEAQPEPVAVAKPKRRWWQYSLTTLLVIVTALGVTLGVIGRRAERQRKAVEAIEALGGSVGYLSDPFATREIRWYQQYLPRDWTDNVWAVSLQNTNATDDDLVHLQSLPDLTLVNLDGTRVTTRGLFYLQGLHYIELLSLENTEVTDEAILYLRRIDQGHRSFGLYKVWIGNTHLTPAGVSELRSFCQPVP